MNSVKVDHNEDYVEETSSNQVNFLVSSGLSDTFGDPEVIPRVGHEYQVEIPPLNMEAFKIWDPTNIKRMADMDNSIQVGLPIPIMWAHDYSLEVCASSTNAVASACMDSENTKICQMVSKSSLVAEYAKGGGMDVDSLSLQQMKSIVKWKRKRRDYFPVPGSPGCSWSDIEQESFLLGLYIFVKDLVQVKRFVQSKKMGEILHFYYGEFYRSEGHHKWSKCRKIKGRRCILGQRIFTGWRQRELLSRLLRCAPEDCRDNLLEASKTFTEGKLSLQDYVTILKATVGLKALVEAVGIGKGKKKDLTRNDIEPVKTNLVTDSRSEIPIGKACSSLTTGEIIKFLTGDFRLSKARLNDLFWEAVWPRLLARGWHSEQPNNRSYATTDHSLVFIIPGIKNFSHRKLVKGNHYFNSTNDVLNKVASDPKLLEVEVEAINSIRCEKENERVPDNTAYQIDSSDHQQNCHLQSVPDRDLERIKFTVVDTSSLDSKGTLKVRELRTLPLEENHVSSNVMLSSKKDWDSIGNQMQEPNLDATMKGDSKKQNSIAFMPDIAYCAISLSEEGMRMNAMDSDDKLTDTLYPDTLKDERQKNFIECQFTQKIESNQLETLASVTKHQRLSSCSSSSHCNDVLSMGGHLKEEKPRVLSFSPNSCDNVSVELAQSEQRVPRCSSGKECSDETGECIHGFFTSTVGDELSHESPLLTNLIDLNPLTSETFITGTKDSRIDSSTKGTSFNSDSNQHQEDSQIPGTAQLPTAESRRHSTRSRPLTRRALEAFESGFFSTRRRRGPKEFVH